MKRTKFLFPVLLSALLLFTACEEDTDDEGFEPTPGNTLCNNDIMDGTETGIDCDTDTSTVCPPCAFCADSLLSSIYNVGDQTGMYEFDVDCGTPECGPCKEELVVQSIGPDGEATPFRDQYSYNKLLSAAGEDTLGLDYVQYPGLKVERYAAGFSGPSYLLVTANQGVMTDSLGIYVRTIKMYIPVPENVVSTNYYLGPGVSIDMEDSQPLAPGGCMPPLQGQGRPFIIYTERLIDNPGMLNRCFFSYVEGGQNSELSIDYLLGYIQSRYYVKGGINEGSIIYEPIPLPGQQDVLGIFSELTFKIHYPFI